ncbi:MAG: hypothetical protein GXO23_03650 [Crenarchaeota archaeon]|nr:hypothetical protein [Thermoproteota archaeon]
MRVNIDHLRSFLEDNYLKEEFKRWYRKYRLVITDLVLVRRLSTFIREELEELKKRSIEINENVKTVIAESWTKAINDLEIDRYSIIRGELNGLNSDVLDIILKIFPNVRHYSRKPFTTTVTARAKRRRVHDIAKLSKFFKEIRRNISLSSVFLCILFIVTLASLIVLTIKNIEIQNKLSHVNSTSPNYTKPRENITEEHRTNMSRSLSLEQSRRLPTLGLQQIP